MTKMVTVYIGFLLLAIHLSSQVHAQVSTKAPDTTGKVNNMPTMTIVSVSNHTTPKGDGTSMQFSVFTLLIPMALAGSLLQGHF